VNFLAVCAMIGGKRTGIVLAGPYMTKLIEQAERLPDRIGYVGGDSFEISVTRAGMMERNAPGAWDVNYFCFCC
jgi:hypothetical protein